MLSLLHIYFGFPQHMNVDHVSLKLIHPAPIRETTFKPGGKFSPYSRLDLY